MLPKDSLRQVSEVMPQAGCNPIILNKGRLLRQNDKEYRVYESFPFEFGPLTRLRPFGWTGPLDSRRDILIAGQNE